MLLKDVFNAVNAIAPFSLSTEFCNAFSSRDNSGIQLDCGKEITGILFSLDLSERAVLCAKEAGANCIITHHPAIFDPLYSLSENGAGREILACAQAGISVLSAHLNLDCAQGGIDDSLMTGLGGNRAEAVMNTLSVGGYGKVYNVSPCSMQEFVRRAEETFHTKRLISYGSAPVGRVASFCGAGFDRESVDFALQNGADTFVSSDGKHHLIATLAEKGLNLLLLTHYSAENFGFEKFYQKIKQKLTGVRAVYFTDERLL